MQVSAVIITYNEEENIARCIDSIEGVVKEIIVVDSFSTDNTVQIAKVKGAIVFKINEGYSQQKNLVYQMLVILFCL